LSALARTVCLVSETTESAVMAVVAKDRPMIADLARGHL
jgi:hypothetical protein